MRLGGPVFLNEQDPERWVAAHKQRGYRAAYCPVRADAGADVIAAYKNAAARADLVIAEVGVWNNPLHADAMERKKALEFNKTQLALAEEIGAVCCVNISGSRGTRWDGPHPLNFTRETFEMIVETVREIIDAVKPTRTFYTLEPMPWMYPDSPDSNLELIRAVNRAQFAVHLDPVNMVCSPQRYLANGAFLRECFEKLGPYIKSVHAKDVTLHETYTTHLEEVRPGLGSLDYRTFLCEMDRLHPDTPLMLEHLKTDEEYAASAVAVRKVASEVGVTL